MKALLIIAALLLAGCNEFTCVEGQVYRRLDGETWIRSGNYAHAHCASIKEKQ